VLGVDYAAFREDEQKVYAVVRALEVIGEAARHIPRKLRLKYPDVPWSKMTGMRDEPNEEEFGLRIDVAADEPGAGHPIYADVLREDQRAGVAPIVTGECPRASRAGGAVATAPTREWVERPSCDRHAPRRRRMCIGNLASEKGKFISPALADIVFRRHA
jgi:hypothetical protein